MIQSFLSATIELAGPLGNLCIKSSFIEANFVYALEVHRSTVLVLQTRSIMHVFLVIFFHKMLHANKHITCTPFLSLFFCVTSLSLYVVPHKQNITLDTYLFGRAFLPLVKGTIAYR